MTVTIVIPMLNEALNAKNLLLEIQRALSNTAGYEIVVVDDGSQDDTKQILLDLRRLIPGLRVICHEQNYGQSAAIVTGVKAAQNEWIITMDGDGQNDPADILLLLKTAHSYPSHQPVLINGNRTKRQDRFIKRISSKLANAVRKKMLKDDCPDSACGLKCFRRQDFLTLPHFKHLHRFMPALYRRAGGQVINISVKHRPRLQGVSKYGIKNRLFVGLIDIFGVFWLLRRPCKPQSFEAE